MKEVNGWVIKKRNADRIFVKLWAGGLEALPCFSTVEKLQDFCDMLQATGIDMLRYEAFFAEGLIDDTILDPEPEILYPRIRAGHN